MKMYAKHFSLSLFALFLGAATSANVKSRVNTHSKTVKDSISYYKADSLILKQQQKIYFPNPFFILELQ